MSSLTDRLVVTTLPLVPKFVVRRVARPYIAGESLEDLVRVSKVLNAGGFLTIAAILGEFVERREEALAAVADFERVLAVIQEEKLQSTIQVKLTQLGLKLDKEFSYQNMRRLVAAARERGNFARIDMEDSTCTDDTLEIYRRLRKEFDNVGAVIQACLRRSREDVRRLIEIKANIRLCKGIYIEPRGIAYLDREIVRHNFTLLLEDLLGAGCYVGIATHDEMLVWEAFRIIDRLGLDPSQYEFQMLLGVEEPLRRIIRDAGHRVRISVPYGPNWYPYSLRRLRKNPRIAGYVFKAMLAR
jgi:proline dehydrogenase